MEMGLKMLVGVSAIGILSLVLFAQLLNSGNPATGTNYGNSHPVIQATQTPIGLGAGGPNNGEQQIVLGRALGTGGYDKPEVRVKAGVPVKFQFSAEQNSGCGRQLVISEFGVNLVSRNGETAEATFTPQKGVYAYRCGMNMFRGKLYVE